MKYFQKRFPCKLFQSCFLFILLPVFSFSKNSFHIFKYSENIEIFPSKNNFVSTVTCSGNSLSESSSMFVPFNELETIDHLGIFYFNRDKKYVRLDSGEVRNNSMHGSVFYQNLRAYQFQIPRTSFFNYSFTKTTSELMCLSALSLNPFSSCDTAEYDITVPKKFSLLYRFSDFDSTITVRIDSSNDNGVIRYRFTAINHTREKTDFENKKLLYPIFLKRFPAIQLLVLPEEKKMIPEEYLNEWFMNLLSRVPELSKKNYKSILEEIQPSNDTDQFIKNVFHFVQSKIKYLDIENGMEAFRPRNPNLVLENKAGDCKDMALLIHSILSRNGIESYLALSASLMHPFDMDFPSPASADHLICVVSRNGSWIFLDATETTCEYGFPSTLIQGKHVFVTGKKMAKYILVQPVDPGMNESRFDLSLQVGKDSIAGNFSYEFRHSSASVYKMIFINSGKTDYESFIHEILKTFSAGYEHEDVTTETNDSLFRFAGEIKPMIGMLNAYSSLVYLPVDFIPYLDWLPKSYKITDPILCYSTLNKKGRLALTFDNPVRLKNSRKKDFSEDGFEFSIEVSQASPQKILVSTALMYNAVTIPREKLSAYHDMILFITTELNKGIIYE